MGEGESFYQGERMPTAKAFDKAGITAPGLEVRDGLASINGSNFISSVGCQLIYDAERWLKQADIAAAMSLEALLANMKPYEARLHELRGFQGAGCHRRKHPQDDRRQRSEIRQGEGQGSGCLQHALHAAGDRSRARSVALGQRTIRDRTERRQ